MKKIIKNILILPMLVILVIIFSNTKTNNNSFAATEGIYNDYKYSIKNSKVTITGYQGSSKNLSIPSNINGYEVVSIGKKAFNGRYDLENIIIPDTVETIEEDAFNFCQGVENISLPNNLKSIGDMAFFASGLKTLTIPNSVKSIGKSAFSCSEKLESVTISKNIINMGTYAFYKCDNLQNVKFEEGSEVIGYGAFEECRNLKEVTMSNSIKRIGSYAFYQCLSLKSINIPNSVKRIESFAFYNSGLQSIKISNSMESIEYAAFGVCQDLKSVYIPDSIKKIDHYAFYYCRNLENVKIPKSVKIIGQSAFYHCIKLDSIIIPDGVKNIGDSTFAFSGLKSIIIPSSVEIIDKWAFYGCKSLSSITIPSDVNSIDKQAFENCKKLTIYGEKNSYAQTYANKYKIPFKVKTITTTLGKVNNLKVDGNYSTSIKLKWSKSNNVSGYEIYRSTSYSGIYNKIGTITNGSTTTYTNTSLATGTTYYYKVRAYRTVDGKKVYSNYSSIVSAKPALSNPSITLTEGTKKVTVKWKKISGASGYEVYRATSKNGKYTNVKTITKGSTVSFTNSTLTKNKTYYYKVRAYRLVNGKKVYSSYSSIKSIKTK